MNALAWAGAAVVSLVAHVAFAAWVDGQEPRKKHVPPPLKIQIANIIKPKPPEAPKPPEPPPPPKVTKQPKLAKQPAAPKAAPPEALKIGVAEDSTAPAGNLAVSTGAGMDGELGTGNAMEAPKVPDAPPVLPAPPAPIEKKPAGPVFIPAFKVTQLPKARNAVQPVIPEAFRDAQREALVVIEVEIDAKGRVVNARVLRKADFGLSEAALAAARQTEFEPALMGTTPVAVRYQLPYRFKVRG